VECDGYCAWELGTGKEREGCRAGSPEDVVERTLVGREVVGKVVVVGVVVAQLVPNESGSAIQVGVLCPRLWLGAAVVNVVWVTLAVA